LLYWRQLKRRTAEELQTFARTAGRLETLSVAERDPVKQSQIRKEIEALTSRIAADQRLFL
jgi:hypothetical protein